MSQLSGAGYFTNASASGPIRYGQLPGSIGVLEALDKPMPIGIASEIGRTEGGLAVWGLAIDGADVPGRWVIIDRQFVAIDGDPTGNRLGLGQGGPAAEVDG
jgi:hypothetical protein